MQLGEANVVCKMQGEKERLIVVPDAMLSRLVKWYHKVTVHSKGVDWLELSIKQHFWHPMLHQEICQQLGNCDTCKQMKKGNPKHGQLAS